jgi:uncharacterized RDD family membrane protein YckC
VARWRDVKKGKVVNTKSGNNKSNKPNLVVGDSAPVVLRLKAFAVDMFMIMMPILYIITYVFLDGKDDYQGSEIAHMVGTILYGFAISLFLAKSGQTPGMKAYEIKVVHSDSMDKLGFVQAFWRYVSFLFSATLLVGLFLAIARKDNKALHDIMSRSRVVIYPNDKSS